MRQFIRGERAKLSELAAINHIWEVGVSIDAPFFIMDYCCLALSANGEVVDDRYIVSYNQPDAPQNAVHMDNVSNNGALFTVNLSRLPSEVRRVVFTATVHKPEMPGGLVGAAFSFFGVGFDGELGEGQLTLSTPAIDTGFFSFTGENFGDESTLILGEFYWKDEWRFVAAGQPLKGELSAFLRTLTDGPAPTPPPSTPIQSASPLAPVMAPPRPPRPVAPAPTPPTVHLPATPSAPIAAPVQRAAIPPASPSQPTVQSISTAPPVIPAPVARPAVAPTQPPAQPALSFPQELEPGETLQNLIDQTPSSSTLTLMRDEYQGPIVINKPLVLEGRDSALWAKSGPIVTVLSPHVSLHNLDIEVTVAHGQTGMEGVALQVQEEAIQLNLHNVRVRGRIRGLGDEDGEWQLPPLLDLGDFAARALNEFTFAVRVPTPVQLSSPVEGVTILPPEVGIGEHQITLHIRDIAPETLIIGFVEVKSASLVRTIPLKGSSSQQAPVSSSLK